MPMILKIVLITAFAVQLMAIAFTIRMVKRTRYNVIWILFIVALVLLSVMLISPFTAPESLLPRNTLAWIAVISSVCLSISAMYAHKLVDYIDRLDRQKQLYNKRMLTAVLRAEEKSRSQFSKELHDGLGPLLSSAKMSLSALSDENAQNNGDPQVKHEILANTTYVIDEAIRSLREISNNLSPHVLNDFGLARGIRNFITRSVPIHDVKIDFATNLHDERFDPDMEVIVYRVVCELVNNSLKHARCRHIRLSLDVDGTLMRLKYSDDGRGFDTSGVMDGGMGLANISSRINSLNGTVDIRSRQGHGMRAAIAVDTAGRNLRDEEN